MIEKARYESAINAAWELNQLMQSLPGKEQADVIRVVSGHSKKCSSQLWMIDAPFNSNGKCTCALSRDK